MARDNYFVVVYKILNYLLECFMTGEQPREEAFGPEELGINYGYWRNVIESIMDEGYVTGVVMVKRMNAEPAMRLDHIKITQKGIEFLQDNSKMQKAKEFIKAIKDTVPGL